MDEQPSDAAPGLSQAHDAEQRSPPGPIPGPKRRRRWYQFTLRAILVLTLLAALLLTVWRICLAPYQAQAETLALTEQLGGSYKADAGPAWMSRLAGFEVKKVTSVDLANCDRPEDYLDRLQDLPWLQCLTVGGAAFSDDRLGQVERLASLQLLVLDCTAVTDEAIGALHERRPELHVYRSDRRIMHAGAPNWSKGRSYQDTILAQWQITIDRVLHSALYDPKLLPQLARCDEIEVLHLNAAITDADLVHLAGLRKLKTVGIWAPISHANVGGPVRKASKLDRLPIGDAGIAHLAALKSLETLLLQRTEIGDSGLAHLKGLTNLKLLNVLGTRITDEGLAHLTELTHLEQLSLSEIPLTDRGMDHIGKLKALTNLDLENTRVGDEGLKYLGDLTNVRRLNLFGTRVTDAGLIHLIGMESLDQLELGRCNVADDGLKHLHQLKHLTRVNLGNTKVTDAGLKHLADIKTLKWLILDGTQITEAELGELRRLKDLSRVDILGTKISREAAAKLQKEMPKCTVWY